MWEEKCCLLFSNISFSSRDIQVLNMQISQVMMSYSHSTKFWSNDKKDISVGFYQKCSILCSMVLLIIVLHNTSSTVLLPWQHTGFQTSPILKAFLATCGIPFWYLLNMVLHMHDLASIILLWSCLCSV